MHVDVGLNLELSQKLIMTPQLCQAIAILQLSAPDLSDLVQQELLCNPVLEVEEAKAAEVPIPENPPAIEPPVDYFDWAEYFNDSSEPFHKSHVTRDTVEFPERPDGAGHLGGSLGTAVGLSFASTGAACDRQVYNREY